MDNELKDLELDDSNDSDQVQDEYDYNKSDTVDFRSKQIPQQSALPPLNSKNERNTFRESMTVSKQNIGSYVMGDLLGKGGFGDVFKGLNTLTGDWVAIKRFSKSKILKDQHSSVSTEFELLQRLNHECVVRILGKEEDEKYIYIFLEYMENGSLSTILNNFGTFPETLVCTYMENVLRGLVYLHSEGVIHRDIKSGNILINKNQAKLSDFGVSAELKESDKRYSVVGTPYWMAPEVIEISGHCQVSDIWSVGCTIIELITSYPPYFDLNPMSAMFRIVQDDHPPLPKNISKELRDFLGRCFVKSVEERATAKELLSHEWITKNRTNIINHQRNTSKSGSGNFIIPNITIMNESGNGSPNSNNDSDSENTNSLGISNQSSRSSSFIGNDDESDSKSQTIVAFKSSSSTPTNSGTSGVSEIEYNKQQMELKLLKFRVAELEKELNDGSEKLKESETKYKEILLSSMHYIYIVDSTMNLSGNQIKPNISNEINHLCKIMREQIETEYYSAYPDRDLVPRFIQRRFTRDSFELMNNIPKKALEAQKRREKEQEKLEKKKQKEKEKQKDKKKLSDENNSNTTNQNSAFYASPITPLSPNSSKPNFIKRTISKNFND
ncbi:hypothetical protein DICPUDRAFT_90653 [Dictyostelium purpureum]|uniref:non-specific serine/threonine protein kinase n=1 Tax=Dictyostelium purpureum TaxID=5786 RepID=F1A401_DICPU|nr:uncharacterized protein DICPUDRAFT_90653 [Dictyostelium purpureum]EGC29075.1 hypothetical protein DICPUDRAFT_90653 [Dictyostelium purpureum]|eukprot:XP_003294395.1 hypothetical protein DICPUDRAFT_90653 [Dictyostelium purpureum]